MARRYEHQFNTIREFNDYINKTPLNALFRWSSLASSKTSVNRTKFTGTKNYDEAQDLLKYGWDDMSKKLEQKLNIVCKEMEPTTKNKAQFDVVGFQASVPRYLQGIPTSMVNKKKVPTKQKVITVVKNIGYSCSVTTEEIIEESVKALAIVKKLEAQGFRVNLDIITALCSSDRRNLEKDEVAICRIRIKSASERLNISKVAFIMVHPSMLRRLVFRFIEVEPNIKSSTFTSYYGYPINEYQKVKQLINKGELYLHNFIGDIDIEIKNLMGCIK